MSYFPENSLPGGAAVRRLLFLASGVGAILAGAAPGARAAVVDFGDRPPTRPAGAAAG
ncbi:MAG: hypothetical protein MUE42_14420 [Opitutaceae bacterium]|nr:hypothetical protein [Opitutaceae bacterium]